MTLDDFGPDGPYAIVDAQGLQLVVNLSRDEAEAITASGTYPPAGDNPGVSYAVPMRVAEVSQQLWREYQESYARKLAGARRDRLNQLLNAYDETTHLCDRSKL